MGIASVLLPVRARIAGDSDQKDSSLDNRELSPKTGSIVQ